MSEDTSPQADQIEGAPHPRETLQLFGQDAAERDFLNAFNDDRLHHGWLITGPRGIGKATLAWRLATFLLANPKDDGGMFAAPAPQNLDVDPNHPVHARIQALSEPGLLLIRRAYDEDKKKFKAQITVDEVRKLKGFFSMSATEGGRRIVIIDCADEMNSNAANALLKLLEEPPRDAVLLLISHQPSMLLPTIRSRCRELRCHALAPEPMAQALAATGATIEDASALSELAGGSVGEALALCNLDGLALYETLVGVVAGLPDFDRNAAIALAETAATRGADARFSLLLRLVDTLLSRLARAGLGMIETPAVRGEAEMLARLSPDADAARKWAEVSADIGARLRHGRAVNLDPAALVLDMIFALSETASKTAA